MNLKELRELIEFLIAKDITEFELERGDVKVRIRRGKETVLSVAGPAFAQPVAPTAAVPVREPATLSEIVPAHSSAAKEAASAGEQGLHMVRSPIVGTYYESPSPGSPPFVKVGDMVEPGQVLCIVEAMKLMNEIESDAAGELVKILVNNAQPIEYGQELFAIRARK